MSDGIVNNIHKTDAINIKNLYWLNNIATLFPESKIG